MAPFDLIVGKNIDEARFAFALKLIKAKEDIVAFVKKRLGWNGTGNYTGFLNGSFNISLVIKRDDSDERVVIRFPIPGNIYEPWRDEKVENEVMVMKYLRDLTSIPVPLVRDWGLTKDSPQHFGPFIIMDFVEGEVLSDLLQQQNENKKDPIVLDPNIDNVKLDFIYEQIADFLLELSHHNFPRIGAISQNATSGQWDVIRRPLTYDMNEVVTLGGYPPDRFTSAAPFDRASDFFAACAQSFQIHLEAQRNIAADDDDLAWKHFVARHCFAQMVPTMGTVNDAGPFRLFCDDLRPTNMLVDPETLRITAVLDLEFTNALPAQYSDDLPWWLLLKQPAIWISEDDLPLHEFLVMFEPRKEQFIRAMERAEAKSEVTAEETRLSARMRDSWDSGRFWFNLASRRSFDVGELYWEVMHKDGLGEAILDSETLGKKKAFLQRKLAQFDAYKREKDNDPRFAA
ncbi:phosphotransferase enzyme family protein [Colletotrichum orchidophilum]|uniref:Phosphotransferase enzyme family protein n=1 Tax=Colletotrichum orchidophilum TaxID=1209926 RepID=A0A1G4AML8_9PEZI|nr:phosphotransferase enzyme family protein [Colletotrichum orchidophilum]OHE90430.1 phosphotransferase enzyme family protein [Colletotrichum orchidophilum]